MTFPDLLNLLYSLGFTGKVILDFRGGLPQAASGSRLLRTEILQKPLTARDIPLQTSP
jgi:hypothetical protein